MRYGDDYDSFKKLYVREHRQWGDFFIILDKLLHLGIKNEQVHFVLRSIFRNFVAGKN